MAVRPSWTKQLSFAVDWERGIPSPALATWESSLRFLNTLIKDHDLSLHHVFIHWHKDPEITHYCGVTYLDEKRMAFCSGNDKETMLHEVAHLQYGKSEHDEKWADLLFTLHHKYLKGAELRAADAALVKDYKQAEKAYKKRFGELPKPVKRRRVPEGPSAA